MQQANEDREGGKAMEMPRWFSACPERVTRIYRIVLIAFIWKSEAALRNTVGLSEAVDLGKF